MTDQQRDTPRPTDDRETAERKSKSVDERVPERQPADAVPEVAGPGAVAANIPQGGVGIDGPLEGGALGPGEAALKREGQAQRQPIQPG